MVWRAAAKDLEHAIAAQDTVQRERERLRLDAAEQLAKSREKKL